jgi:hypothetical protein
MNPQKLKIINIGPEEAGEEPVEQNGSSYGNGEVLINLNLYENETGTGIKERQYYFVDQYGIPLKKLKSVANSLFHEFTHCLHDAENSDLYSLYCQPPGEKDPNEEYIVWSNSEEERTIAGFIPPNTYDPICENCFDLCNTVAQRTKYRPRIGHFGYQKGIVEYRDVVLIPLYRGLPFKLDWPIKYGHA